MTWKTKRMSTVAGVIGVVCGAELVIAIMVGASGLGALFGWEGLIVGIAILVVVVGMIKLRRAHSCRDQLADASLLRVTSPDADREDLLGALGLIGAQDSRLCSSPSDSPT